MLEEKLGSKERTYLVSRINNYNINQVNLNVNGDGLSSQA